MEKDTREVPVVPLVIGAASVLVVMAGVAVAKETGLIEPGLSKRLVGLTIAFLLVLAGNFLPKLGLFRAFTGTNQARLATAELMAGRILVLAGIVIMGIWAFAAISRAPLGAALIGLAAIFLALASWLWLKPGAAAMVEGDREAEGETEIAKQRSALRSTILHILHGIAWASIMLLADEIWGDRSIKWTVIAFVLSMGLMTTLDVTLRARQRNGRP